MMLIRKYATPFMLILLCWYHYSINFSTHIHILNGTSVVHSHPGSAQNHTHSESQFATIDLLASFSTDIPEDHFNLDAPFGFCDEAGNGYLVLNVYNQVLLQDTLRGPPQEA
jgi:hypothetical protein